MIKVIEEGIKELGKRVSEQNEPDGRKVTADEALKFTQAVSNLTNARASIISNPIEPVFHNE